MFNNPAHNVVHLYPEAEELPPGAALSRYLTSHPLSKLVPPTHMWNMFYSLLIMDIVKHTQNLKNVLRVKNINIIRN